MSIIDVVIPARNEENTIGPIVKLLKSHRSVGKVIVADNGSIDLTAEIAEHAGALVIKEQKVGLGFAVKSALSLVDTDLCLRTDADINNWDLAWLEKMLVSASSSKFTRATFSSPYDTFPVTNLVVKPWLKRMKSEWGNITLPISGTYLFNPHEVDWSDIRNDWAFDISLLVFALENGLSIEDIDIGSLSDKQRPMKHYVPMAEQILDFFVSKQN